VEALLTGDRVGDGERAKRAINRAIRKVCDTPEFPDVGAINLSLESMDDRRVAFRWTPAPWVAELVARNRDEVLQTEYRAALERVCATHIMRAVADGWVDGVTRLFGVDREIQCCAPATVANDFEAAAELGTNALAQMTAAFRAALASHGDPTIAAIAPRMCIAPHFGRVNIVPNGFPRGLPVDSKAVEAALHERRKRYRGELLEAAVAALLPFTDMARVFDEWLITATDAKFDAHSGHVPLLPKDVVLPAEAAAHEAFVMDFALHSDGFRQLLTDALRAALRVHPDPVKAACADVMTAALSGFLCRPLSVRLSVVDWSTMWTLRPVPKST
jgi:hypothetical protein